MPANVSIEFEKAKKQYDEARTPLEKLIALQEMQKTAPSHKGGENLRADISRKIAQLKREMEYQVIIGLETDGLLDVLAGGFQVPQKEMAIP